MAAVSVVDLQFAEIDFGRDIFEVEGITKLSWISQFIKQTKLKACLEILIDLTLFVHL